ncbi:cilia- and flagella-associated protein 70 [Calliopsis andreniformis]|uniref:cilia- and flagella-associated protein 70 n=1 Tax=Calliopsis andreniformis TaxID=337506 RepID=UPI003FCE63A8
MEHSLLTQSLLGDKKIEISIDSIQNIIRKEDISVSFIVEHNGIVLGESSPVFVKSTCDDDAALHDIDFAVYLTIIKDDENSLSSIVSTPVLITATYTTEGDQEECSSTTNSEVKKRSIYTINSSSVAAPEILGICNLDVMPIILGERCFTEKLILETPNFSYDGTFISWQNLPQLAITVSQDSTPIFETETDLNFLNMTIESVYNIPENFTENLEYKVGSVIYINSEIPENVIFENGMWTKYRDVERTKRWKTLTSLKNRARLSKFKLDCDYMGVKNEFRKQIDLPKKVCDDAPRIEWNAVHRCVLWKMGIESMQNHIRRYKYWPFQFMVTEQDPQQKSKATSASKPQLYQCYVDFSELLFPGKKNCRVVGQLHTFNPNDISEKVGLEKNIFELDTRGKESKEREKKGGRSSKNAQSTHSEGEVQVPTAGVTSKNEEPTIVVIEIELYEPLIACKIQSDFTGLIEDLIPIVEKKTPYVYSGEMAEKQYTNCIQKLAEVLTESYRDELTCFTQYLYTTGVYLALRSTLKAKVTMLLDQKFRMPQNLVDSNKTQSFIASVYTYLVEQMHVAINKIVEGRYAEDLQHTVDSDRLLFYAEEAYELENFEKARHYYTTVIAANKENSEVWRKYAVFLKKIGDVERARQCCLEAIALDRKNAIALLLYAAILFEEKNYRNAEIFFRAITDLHPRFFEGWVILHLFYIRTEYYPGIDLTLRIAEKCIKDKSREIILYEQPLCWSMVHCLPDNVYTMTATFLLKLHLCELAGIALAQEMLNSNRSIPFLYYMAVDHYLTGRFEDALSHLEEAKCNYGMDYSVSSLMGHCYFKLGDNEKAIECFEFSRMLFDRPIDLHLIEIRLGHHYYNTGNFERAKKLFLNVCSSSPTSVTWFGAGLSCYELDEYQEAETCLSEANRLDNCNPDIWGYLCLLNMTLRRYDEFSQCYREMVKYQNNLQDRKLWLKIMTMMEALDYISPVLVTESDDLIEDHGEESEEQFENGNGT